ncbi:MAG: hypothetical protein RJA63_3020 [Pseudomonadota bacterium]|jgi:hypothetical protein
MPAPTLHFKPRHLVTLLACALSPLAASAAAPFTGLSKAWTFSLKTVVKKNTRKQL